jgi:hypothetical protein
MGGNKWKEENGETDKKLRRNLRGVEQGRE